MDLTRCPECAAPAQIQWRRVVESTGGPVEQAKIVCVRRHWFLLPVALLAAREIAATPLAGANERGRPVATARIRGTA